MALWLDGEYDIPRMKVDGETFRFLQREQRCELS